MLFGSPVHDAQHDDEFGRTSGYAETFFTRKIVRKAGDAYEYDGVVWRMKQRTSHYRVWRGMRDPDYNEINFWGLCTGENFQVGLDCNY
jgi:hypothetical protein